MSYSIICYAGRYAVGLALGAGDSCVLLSGGRTVCWGDNSYGQLGVGSTTNVGTEPGQMGVSLELVNLAPGIYYQFYAAKS